MSELNKPAMPQMDAFINANGEKPIYTTEGGLSIRQHAAITLRVPMSGDPELDAMIREARRLDAAEKAMQAALSQGLGGVELAEGLRQCADASIKSADALLTASEPKKDEIETISELRSRISQKMDDCTKSVKRIDELTVALEKARLHCLISEWNPAVQEAIAVIEEALSASEPKNADDERKQESVPTCRAVSVSAIERMKHAVEGELDGLAITDTHARAILEYVLGTNENEVDWSVAEWLIEQPRVDEALRNFADDKTASNAECLVMAILESGSAIPGRIKPKADANGWIEHDGISRPVSERTQVVPRFRCGETGEVREADDYDWKHRGINSDGKYDIIAYRVVKEAEA